MPTNKKIMVNGVEQPPIKKTKVPPEMDWQAVVRERQKAAEEQEQE